MKRFLAFTFVAVAALSASAVLAYSSPGKPAGFVNDFAGIFAPADRAALESKLSGFERQTGNEIVVATVSSLGGDTVDNYAVRLFADWGIGKKKLDNGLLILVALNDRKARIEVGYGLEPTVTDAEASVLIRKVMLPAFQAGDYIGGVNGTVDKIIGLIQNDPEAVKFASAPVGERPVPLFVPLIGIALLILLISTRWGRRFLAFFFIRGLFSRRGGRGGWGGGSSSGGGFGGFGGGSSGGGGASSGW